MNKKFLVKWMLCFVILGLSFYMSLKTSFASFRLLFWSTLSIITVSFTWLAAAYFGKRLYLKRNITLKIEEDDYLDITLEINNKGFLPVFDVILEDYLGCAHPEDRKKFILVDFLKSGSESTLVYSCFCPQRGRYDLGPITAYFFDPLGMFYFKKTYPVYSELFVYPRTFRIRKFPSLNKGVSPWLGIDTARVSGDEDEFYGVREYKSGDPIKKIHWMASARNQQLIVKEFQHQTFLRATIMFNLEKDDNFGEGKESVAEYSIKIVASVAKYLISIGVSVEIIYHAGEVVHIPFNKGADHLDGIFKLLTIAQAESRITLLELFETFQRNIQEDSSLIIVMTAKNKAFMQTMLSLGQRNVSLVPVFIISSTFLRDTAGSQEFKDYAMNLPENVKLNPIYISRGDNLEEKF